MGCGKIIKKKWDTQKHPGHLEWAPGMGGVVETATQGAAVQHLRSMVAW